MQWNDFTKFGQKLFEKGWSPAGRIKTQFISKEQPHPLKTGQPNSQIRSIKYNLTEYEIICLHRIHGLLGQYREAQIIQLFFLKFHRNSVQTDDIPGSGSLYSFWKTFHIVVLHMVPYVTKIHVFAVFKVVSHVWSLNSSIFKAFRRTLNLWDKMFIF